LCWNVVAEVGDDDGVLVRVERAVGAWTKNIRPALSLCGVSCML